MVRGFQNDRISPHSSHLLDQAARASLHQEKHPVVTSDVRSIPHDFCNYPPVDWSLKRIHNWLRHCGENRTAAWRKNTFALFRTTPSPKPVLASSVCASRPISNWRTFNVQQKHSSRPPLRRRQLPKRINFEGPWNECSRRKNMQRPICAEGCAASA